MADLAAASPTGRLILRGGPAVAEAAGATLGLTLPQDACRAAGDGERSVLWLGPDEWLILAPVDPDEDLAAALETALADRAHALVDVSARQIGLILTGPDAETVLAVGCPLDLDLAAFPVGMCTRTLLSKAEIVLWRTAQTTFRIEVWRSFGDYVRGILAVGGAVAL